MQMWTAAGDVGLGYPLKTHKNPKGETERSRGPAKLKLSRKLPDETTLKVVLKNQAITK